MGAAYEAERDIVNQAIGGAAILDVSVLGGFSIAHRAWLAPPRVTRTVQALLSYLLLNGDRAHAREALAEIFWPEYNPPQAQKCLSTALWRLRSIIEPRGIARGTFFDHGSLGEIRFRRDSSFRLDAIEFEQGVRAGLDFASKQRSTDAARSLEAAVEAYRGDLLPAFDGEWITLERERLKQLAISGLEQLAGCYRTQGDNARGLDCLKRILALEPLREDVHREVMRAHCELGQRALALRQYQVCGELLKRELDVEPAPETQGLHARIARQSSAPPPPSVASIRPGQSRDLRAELMRTLDALESARREIRAALELVNDGEPRSECSLWQRGEPRVRSG
jgi:DNA-binding SARP family transcriptional activator